MEVPSWKRWALANSIACQGLPNAASEVRATVVVLALLQQTSTPKLYLSFKECSRCLIIDNVSFARKRSVPWSLQWIWTAIRLCVLFLPLLQYRDPYRFFFPCFQIWGGVCSELAWTESERGIRNAVRSRPARAVELHRGLRTRKAMRLRKIRKREK